MRGLQPLFLGIFGIFAFSWLGMTVVPNLQIGSLNPQTDDDGGDAYPLPPSGMVLRGARVYAANGCVYCHSQQVRPEYGGSDIERHWGERRSAPRDYIFEPIVFLGKMRVGPDLANVGHQPAVEEKKAAASSSAPSAGASPAAATAGTTPPAVAATPALAAAASPASAVSAGAPATASPAGDQAAVTLPTSLPAVIADVAGLTASGEPLPNTAAWHHRHLYNPRSISEDSNMPAYRFLYEKRRIGGARSFESINFAGDEAEGPGDGWEIVPSYDARCLVAYLMSRDQSHPLKEAEIARHAAARPGQGGSKMSDQIPENPPRQGMDYGETEEVQVTHAAIYREKVEPRIGREPLSLWLIAIYGLAVFFGGAYLGRYAGDFSGNGLDFLGGAPRVATKGGGNAGAEQAAELTPAEKGKKIFSANCATCHQANGLGVAGQYPPLAGSEIVNGGARRPAMIVLKGLQGPLTVKGQHFGSAVMQPWEKTLNDQKIADVLTYIRQEWGNTAGPVGAEGVSALRKELAGRAESWTEPDILAVPGDADLPGGAPPAAAEGTSTPGANPPPAQPKS